jgi:hypothetical protein
MRRCIGVRTRKAKMEKDLSSIMVTAMNCGTMDDESLGLLLQGLKESAAEFRQAVSAVSYEVHRRLVANKGTMLPHSTLEIKRQGSPTYDVGKVKALTELLTPTEAAALIHTKHTPAKDETVVSGQKANSLLKAYGEDTEVGKAIIAARLPESTSFTVTEKK